MKPYDEYKTTNLDWLPRVPKHWEVKRAKFVFKTINERSVAGKEELLSVSHITGVTKRKASVTMFKAESYVGYKICRKNDLVINSMWAWMGALGVAPLDGIVSTAYSVYRMNESQLAPAFANLVLRIKWYAQDFENRSKGIWTSRLILSDDAFGNTLLALPPLDEQKRIVSYLGAKNREIESYIAAKRALLLRLKELSAAVISRAVTRGVNANVETKESGVEWLGDLPKHWEVKRLKFVVDFVSRGNTPTYAVESDVRVINQACVSSDALRLEKCKFQSPEFVNGIENWKGFVRPNDILVNSTGTGTLGRVALFEETEGIYFADGHVTIVRDSKGRVIPRFLMLMLSTKQDWITAEAAEGATNQIELSRSAFRALKIPLPPLEEQRAIVAFIEAQLATIREAQTRIEREIELARELWTTLVAEVVTGQIDVSDWEDEDEVPAPSAEVFEIEEEEEGTENEDAFEEALIEEE